MVLMIQRNPPKGDPPQELDQHLLLFDQTPGSAVIPAQDAFQIIFMVSGLWMGS